MIFGRALCTSSYMPQPDDSGGPSHPCLFPDASVSASVYVKTLADLNLHFEAVPTLRVCGYPYGLQDSLCTLRLSCSQDFTHSATDATLDTGGWLNLTGQGLPPCKVHQALLGALTIHWPLKTKGCSRKAKGSGMLNHSQSEG